MRHRCVAQSGVFMAGPSTTNYMLRLKYDSGSLRSPIMRNVSLIVDALVPGCPPPTLTLYLSGATDRSPATFTMLRSRGSSRKLTCVLAPAVRCTRLKPWSARMGAGKLWIGQI